MTPPTIRTCARCDKPMDPVYRPFCSKRCADIDLQKWLTGAYAIPGSETEDDSDTEQGGES